MMISLQFSIQADVIQLCVTSEFDPQKSRLSTELQVLWKSHYNGVPRQTFL